jgi:hypothetical protein
MEQTHYEKMHSQALFNKFIVFLYTITVSISIEKSKSRFKKKNQNQLISTDLRHYCLRNKVGDSQAIY